ncbi:hypothetical protein AACH06_09390 [Ideonella sp. DXS29W]|uniref:Uncharacterized protein n=1 Tax=Ideonella lacteola TaxID=2984193 RepID=A0ABU9BM44_9BURK
MDPQSLTLVHRRRLREVWRSAGWPCQDGVEVELLAAGWLERRCDAQGRETLRVTDAGVQVLAATLQRNRAARDAHEALVARVALEMQRAGRVVWRGLSLRAPVAGELPGPDGQVAPVTRWAIAMPDVYSIRHTTVEDYVEPVVHEVKVRRADLLGDLKRPTKGEAYRALCGECWYVLKAGIGEADEVPDVYGVMRAHPLPGTDEQAGLAFGALEVLRPAPRRAFRLPFSVWMALARANAEPADDDAQSLLGESGGSVD